MGFPKDEGKKQVVGQDAWRKAWSFDFFFFFEHTGDTKCVVTWYVYIQAKAEVIAEYTRYPVPGAGVRLNGILCQRVLSACSGAQENRTSFPFSFSF